MLKIICLKCYLNRYPNNNRAKYDFERAWENNLCHCLFKIFKEPEIISDGSGGYEIYQPERDLFTYENPPDDCPYLLEQLLSSK